MALQLFPLDPANPNSLSEITPKNWHRYPPVALPTAPIDVPVVAYTGGVVNEGAQADNDGETGTINQTGPAYTPLLQKDKAAQLGTTMAVDVTKSYGTKARGSIAPFNQYPSANAAVVPDAFKPASQL